MILRRVVHDEVHAEADALLVALLGEVREIVHGAELGHDRTEVGHRVPAVGAALVGRRVEERHEVQVVDVAALDVGQLLLDALDGAGKVVDVHLHAEHVLATIPRAGGNALVVEGAELVVARIVERLHLLGELGEHVAVVVELHVEPAQLVVMVRETLGKHGVGLGLGGSCLLGIRHLGRRLLGSGLLGRRRLLGRGLLCRGLAGRRLLGRSLGRGLLRLGDNRRLRLCHRGRLLLGELRLRCGSLRSSGLLGSRFLGGRLARSGLSRGGALLGSRLLGGGRLLGSGVRSRLGLLLWHGVLPFPHT